MENEIVKMKTQELVDKLLDLAAESGEISEYSATVVLITGHSGVGKTYASYELEELASGYEDVKVLNLDALGEQKDGKWIVNVAKFKSTLNGWLREADCSTLVIIEGISNNMDEIYNVVKDSLADESIYMVIQPNFDLFRRNQELKADQGEEDNLPENWIQHWRKLSKMSDSQLSNWFAKENAFMLSKVDGMRKGILVPEYNQKKHSGKAWHPKKG